MNTLRRIDWRKFGHSLRIQGALSVMVVAISQVCLDGQYPAVQGCPLRHLPACLDRTVHLGWMS